MASWAGGTTVKLIHPWRLSFLIPWRPWDWWCIYLHFLSKSTIHVGKYTIHGLYLYRFSLVRFKVVLGTGFWETIYMWKKHHLYICVIIHRFKYQRCFYEKDLIISHDLPHFKKNLFHAYLIKDSFYQFGTLLLSPTSRCLGGEQLIIYPLFDWQSWFFAGKKNNATEVTKKQEYHYRWCFQIFFYFHLQIPEMIQFWLKWVG